MDSYGVEYDDCYILPQARTAKIERLIELTITNRIGKEAIDFQLKIYTPSTKHSETKERQLSAMIVIAIPCW